MKYTFTGKIVWVSKMETGLTGAIKRKVQIVLQDGTRSLAMWVFDDNIEKFLGPVELQDTVIVEFSVKSREWKGKWTTDCYCLSMLKVGRERRQRTHREYSQQATNHFQGCTTASEIKKRYRDLCKKYHPDTGNGDEKIMQEVNYQHSKFKR